MASNSKPGLGFLIDTLYIVPSVALTFLNRVYNNVVERKPLLSNLTKGSHRADSPPIQEVSPSSQKAPRQATSLPTNNIHDPVEFLAKMTNYK